jgi:hypothetical protein
MQKKERLLQASILVAKGLIGAQAVTEGDMVFPKPALEADGVKVDARRVRLGLDEVATIRKFVFVLLDVLVTANVQCFYALLDVPERRSAQQDVDDWLRAQARNGCASDVLNRDRNARERLF